MFILDDLIIRTGNSCGNENIFLRNQMAILDTYYRIIEKNPDRVSKIWKDFHVLLFIIGGVSSFSSAYTFSGLINLFDGNCPLNANLIIDNSTTNITSVRRLNPDVELPVKNAEIEWPIRETWCNFCTTAFVLSFIYCAFWITLFMLCPKGGGAQVGILQQAWKIVIPTLIFSLLFIVLMIIAVLKVREGLYNFCYQLAASLLYEECSSQIDIYSLSFSQKEQSIFLYIQICVYSAYVSCLCWIVQTILLIIRVLLVVDFTILKITLMECGDKHGQKKVDNNSPELKPLTSPEGVQIFQKREPSKTQQGTSLYEIRSSSVSLESEDDTVESRV